MSKKQATLNDTYEVILKINNQEIILSLDDFINNTQLNCQVIVQYTKKSNLRDSWGNSSKYVTNISIMDRLKKYRKCQRSFMERITKDLYNENHIKLQQIKDKAELQFERDKDSAELEYRIRMNEYEKKLSAHKKPREYTRPKIDDDIIDSLSTLFND